MTDSHQPTATLTVTLGPEPGRSFELGVAPVTIGREAPCEIQVEGTWVSRRHARITWTGTGYIVEDLGSTNGTYVNDEPVRAPRPLSSGDRLQLGRRVELAFEVVVPAPVQAQPMPVGIAPTPAVSAGPPPQAPPSEPVPARQEPFLRRKSTRAWGLALLGLLLIVIIGVGTYYLFADGGQQVADKPTEQPALPHPTSTPTPIPPTPTPSPVPGGTISGRAYLMDREKPVRTMVLLQRKVGEKYEEDSSTETDKDGCFSFLIEEPGTFRVEISVMHLLDTCDNLRTESGGWGATQVYDGSGLTDVRASSLGTFVTLEDSITVDCELYCD
jgi:hypothetical protein